MYDGKTLYYMTAMDNIPDIYKYGLVSRNVIERSILRETSRSIDDKAVNSRRGNLQVFGKSLHDYVPLYWATHTPMQYVITQKEKTIEQHDLVFVVFDLATIELLQPIVTTDGNAACVETNFYDGWGAVPHLIEEILACKKCLSKDYRRRKCAEVLVGRAIPPVFFSYLAVKSQTALGNLRKLLPAWESRVRVCPEFYY
jgi:hypothetical protein